MYSFPVRQEALNKIGHSVPGVLHIYSNTITVERNLVKISHPLIELVIFYRSVEANSDDLIHCIGSIINRFASVGFL